MQNNPNFHQLSVKANVPGAVIEAKNESWTCFCWAPIISGTAKGFPSIRKDC
jgi:hypothetical protein